MTTLSMTRWFMCATLCLGCLGWSEALTTEGDLRVGAFNIQVFGRSKSAKEDVMALLVQIVRRYDILLIQEIRDSSGEAIQTLLERVKQGQASELQFSRVLGERAGRTSSKEQYAFFYRHNKGLSVTGNYTYDDGPESGDSSNITDTFQREPLVVAFHSEKTALQSFTLVAIHVAPSTAVEEINELYNVFYDAKLRLNNNDVMVLGDLNADCSYVSQSAWANIPIKTDSSYSWLIKDTADTTVSASDCAYDRFISTGTGWETGIRMHETGNATTYRFDEDVTLGDINQTLALAVSDHYPIEFLLKGQSFAEYLVTEGVYVDLADTSESLSQTLEYQLHGITVKDLSGKTMGTLRTQKDAEQRVVDTVTSLQGSLQSYAHTMIIKAVKNKYAGDQKANLIIIVKSTHLLKSIVEDRLNYGGVSYQVTYT